MGQLWALHVVINRQFLTFIFAVFLLNLFYVCILLHKPIYGFVETNRSRLEYNFWFRFFCELNHRRHRYDVTKVFKMAAVDVAN